MSDAKRWGRLKDDWQKLWKRQYEKTRASSSAECGRLIDTLRAEYESAGAPPSPSDLDLEAIRLVLHQDYYDAEAIIEDIVSRWTDEADASFAVRALLRAITFELSWSEDAGNALTRAEPDRGIDAMRPIVWGIARRALARVQADERRSAAEAARACFSGPSRAVRLLLAYLFPDEEGFFSDEDHAWALDTPEDRSPDAMLYTMAAVRKSELATRWGGETIDVDELTAALGDAAVGALRLRVLDAWGPWCRDAAAALANIETQAAADVLAEHAHHSHIGPVAFVALRQRPEQGIVALTRFLSRHAAAKRGKNRQQRSKPDAARSLLFSIVNANRALASRMTSELEGDAAVILGAILDETAPRPEADPSELPPILASPPWKKAKKKRSVKGTKKKAPAKKRSKAPRPETLVYDERVVWGNVDPKTLTQIDPDDPPTEKEDAETIARLEEDRRDDGYSFLFIIRALTDAPALRILKEWPPEAWYGQVDDVEAPLARFGLDALDPLIAFCRKRPDRSEGLRYVDSPRVAPLFAHCYANVKKTRAVGEAWLLAYPRAAAVGLVPELFDAKGKAKKAAEEAVRLLASKHGEVLLEVAAEYGADAREIVGALISSDASPLAQLKRAPKLPKFFDPSSLPRPVLRTGKALSIEAVTDLATLLAVVPPGTRMKEVDELAPAFDERSLARFSWSLFTEWLLAGASSKQKWAFFVLSHFGDADAARALGPMIKEWAPGGFPSRAQLGIDVLKTMGTDAALLEIHKTAERVRSRALARHAKNTMDAIAKERGLSREELADRLVPDLDLDENGSRVFDYGPRKFRVRFDEHLVASVVDGAGEARKDLPKPNAGDVAELAEEARVAFRRLKKEAKSIAKDRITRLERAMIEGRTWPRDTFLSFFALHPLLGHLARRLVWGTVGEGPREVQRCFRVAEDGSLADLDDQNLELSPDAAIVVVHPATLSKETLKRWGDLFSDYEILQPFAQLSRPLPELVAAERAAMGLSRFADALPSKKVLRLVRRGWRAPSTEQGGMIDRYERVLGALRAVVTLEPGLYAGDLDLHPEQKLGPLTLLSHGEPIALGAADRIVVGELIRDLESVFQS